MSKFNLSIILVAVSLGFHSLLAQSTLPQTQTIRGIVTDKISEEPLVGAVVSITSTNPTIKTSTDEKGAFKLVNVPIGKQTIKVVYMGYKPSSLENLTLNVGKELVLNIGLEEDIKLTKEIVITAKEDKNTPNNELSTVSTRKFSVEETQKFAAAVNDPARMVTSFAGVVSADDGNNSISIRGNSPNGLLWRMEGVEIPNPNHFSSVSTAGGGVSILSAQLLANSDFSTGAFAAEYGNALSGVFDLRLRKGNNEKREYTFQAGFLGFDLSTEGYFKKGYAGSYVINYRYSTLSLLGVLGVPLGDGITKFQDLSFNIALPTKKLGTFGVFGFGGLSSQYTVSKKDSSEWKKNDFSRYDTDFKSNTGAVGITNKVLFANKSYLKTALVFSGTQNGYTQDQLTSQYLSQKQYYELYNQSKITLSSTYTQKLNVKNSIRTGFIYNILNYGLVRKDGYDTTVLIEKINQNGQTSTFQGFAQWNHKFSPKFSTILGLHYFQLFLNNSTSIEPRASLRYDITEKNIFTIGYGLHSQLQPIGVYFTRTNEVNNSFTIPNKNLGLSKAHHLVLGFDKIISQYSHLKTEIYYQSLFNIPISTSASTNYSILNANDGFVDIPLVNKGLGKNYGTEMTYEKFLNKGLYYMVTGSLFESKFKTPDNQWYNTRFNTNYASVITLGKEWTLSEKKKNRVIGLNIKSVLVGGKRYTPLNEKASIEKGSEVYDVSRTFGVQNPDYYRIDFKISCKRNFKKITSTWSLDIQNATNRKNVGGQYFDKATLKVKYYYQTPLIPILSYRLEF